MSLLIALVFYQGLIHTANILFRETKESFVFTNIAFAVKNLGARLDR